MSTELISRILYLTHDVWNKHTVIKSREEFKEFLENFVLLEPESEKDLEVIAEVGEGEDDKLVIMKGVMSVLKQEYPDTYQYLVDRINARERKKNLHQ